MTTGTILAISLAVLLVAFVISGIRIVPQAQVMMVERLGRFHRIARSGFNFIIPVIDNVRRFRGERSMQKTIDQREQVMDFPPQPVITRDNVTMQVDSVIYYKIQDPKRAMYEIEDLSTAIRQLAVTNLRNLLGELDLDQTLTSRETVNSRLQRVLDEASDVWGVKVTRVELKNILPPREIEDAMAKQMKAERERRAVVLEAEGEKKSAVLRAEGERDAAIAAAEGVKAAAILEAEGRAQAIVEVAKANAQGTLLNFNAIHEGRADKEVLAIRYLETLQAMSDGKANKIFLPFEATGILGSIAAVAEAAREKS